MFVTDTHPLIWYLAKNTKLTKKAKAVFDDAVARKTAIYVPTIVLWEISLLLTSGDDLKLGCDYPTFIQRLFTPDTFIEKTFNSEIVRIAHDLNFNDDPFDKAIVATAIHMDLKLISGDGDIHDHTPCELVW